MASRGKRSMPVFCSSQPHRPHLKPDGHLFIGHSETLNGIDRGLGLVQVRPTIYALR
jgi:hypothetical protein